VVLVLVQVVVEAVVGVVSLSDIGLDDTIFSSECVQFNGPFPTSVPSLAASTPSPCADPLNQV
jgi:hypothetical protein